MLHRVVDASDSIRNTPQAVIAFIADIRHRQQYVPALKEVTNIHGEPTQVGNGWHWKFEALGREFEGDAECTQYEAGSLYAFRTMGDLGSQWTYRAEAQGEGTLLKVHVEYDVPDSLLASLPPNANPDAMEQAEGTLMFQKLKELLDQ